jgi:hypothetical protein
LLAAKGDLRLCGELEDFLALDFEFVDVGGG